MKTLIGMDKDDKDNAIPTPIYKNYKNVTYLKRGRLEFDKDGKIIFVEDEEGNWIVFGSQ